MALVLLVETDQVNLWVDFAKENSYQVENLLSAGLTHVYSILYSQDISNTVLQVSSAPEKLGSCTTSLYWISTFIKFIRKLI